MLRGGAIGDFILTLPVLAALRRSFPDARLEVLGYPHIASLALAGGLVDQVRSLEDPTLCGFFAGTGELDPVSTRYFSGFDTVVSYLYDPQGVFHRNLARCSSARLIRGLHRPDDQLPIHATEILLAPLAELGIHNADPVPRLRLPSTADSFLPPGQWLAVHPGSGSERKNWPEQLWAQFLSQVVTETSLQILLVGGEAEGERLQRLATAVRPERLLIAQHLPLPRLGRLLAQCAAYLGHDSGISHLAAAVGQRGVVLWGETNAVVWRPCSDTFSILHHASGLAQLPVPPVIEALRDLLSPKAQQPL